MACLIQRQLYSLIFFGEWMHINRPRWDQLIATVLIVQLGINALNNFTKDRVELWCLYWVRVVETLKY